IHAFHAFSAPRFHHFEGSHEHFVKTKGIRSELMDHIVRIDDIAPRFGHLLTIFAKNKSLVYELEEGLGGGDIAQIEQHFMPEAVGLESVRSGGSTGSSDSGTA